MILNAKISFSVDEDNKLYLNYPFSAASNPYGDGNGGFYFTDVDYNYNQAKKLLFSDINGCVTYFHTSFGAYNFAIKSIFSFNNLFNYKNVVSVCLFSGSDWSGSYVCCRYYDASGYYLQLSFYVADNFKFPIQTYYFNEGIDLTDNEFYNQGYNAGQNDGYNKGYSFGEYDGYNSGYKAGNTVGYENGYNKGLSDSNQYTFINLIGATIDAPIHYFQSLFNFELLGVNLSSFLMGLFTLCVVVTIVKLCLGR